MFSRISRLTRREFLVYGPLSIAGLIGAVSGIKHYLSPSSLQKFKGSIVGANAKVGHLMRTGKFPAVVTTSSVETVIVGGGVAGLSSAWWLQKHGHQDFLLLELDTQVGGNSQSGSNEVSRYPWGAHYLPLPGPEAVYVKALLEELKVIKGDHNGSPVYDEYYLCADPGERLYFQGRWHEGLIPQTGIPPADEIQHQEFLGLMKEYSHRRGGDGKFLFTIPVDRSSQDEEFTRLDKISMTQFLDSRGWTAPTLRWYVDYCCKDDYGQAAKDVSAWAGIHYFASRSGKADNAGKESVLTWPEGNGWLVKKLEEKFPEKIKKSSLAFNIQKNPDGGLFVDTYDVTGKTSSRILAKNVIYAAPRFTAKYSVHPTLGKLTQPQTSSTPWLVANVTVTHRPEGRGHELAWDNVSYYSPSLGYIVATHQALSHLKKETVLTYYLPLTDEAPAVARVKAFQRDHSYWSNLVAADLEKMHPGITQTITAIDAWVWGHGMVGPGVGYLWGENRKEMQQSLGDLHFAHTEMSGISIFEEAQYRGVMAAKKVLERRG
ncbi:MAG TPA: FAD-dependent oxidoreductase [Bacteriovoracaceae bacterium]|nr:FAD-dependent oxidoreductase [Bacteriovoracaceae bacterium]